MAMRPRLDCPPRVAASPLSLVPSEEPVWGVARDLRFMRHLVLRFDIAALAETLSGTVDLADIDATRLMFHDATLLRLAWLFADECASTDPVSTLYGDGLSVALMASLARLGRANPPEDTRGGLAAWQLRRVVDYLEAHLAQDIQLQTLAGLVRLSRSHFGRAFKASTGLAPHQWQLNARIARAQTLMMGGNRLLAEIALDLGFADQAHFTRVFRRAVGTSPGSWRRTHR